MGNIKCLQLLVTLGFQLYASQLKGKSMYRHKYNFNLHIARLQFIRTVDRLAEAIAVAQIGCQLERVHLLEGHRGQRGQFPQQHAEAPHVARRRVVFLLQRFERHPLDRPVLVIAEAMIVIRE